MINGYSAYGLFHNVWGIFNKTCLRQFVKNTVTAKRKNTKSEHLLEKFSASSANHGVHYCMINSKRSLMFHFTLQNYNPPTSLLLLSK